jgi:hypothetical protein
VKSWIRKRIDTISFLGDGACGSYDEMVENIRSVGIASDAVGDSIG